MAQLHDRADALAHLLRGGVLARPDGQQHGHHVGGRDPVDALPAKLRAGVLAQRRLPAVRVSAAGLPRRTVDGEHGGDGLVEGGNAGGAARGRARVAARAGDSAVGEGAFAGLGQGHEGEAPEAERAGLSVNNEPLDPVSGSGGLDVEVESVAVAIPARLDDAAAEGGRECLAGMGALGLGLSGAFGGCRHMLFPVQFCSGLKRPFLDRTGRVTDSGAQKTLFYKGIYRGSSRKEQDETGRSKVAFAPNATMHRRHRAARRRRQIRQIPQSTTGLQPARPGRPRQRRQPPAGLEPRPRDRRPPAGDAAGPRRHDVPAEPAGHRPGHRRG